MLDAYGIVVSRVELTVVCVSIFPLWHHFSNCNVKATISGVVGLKYGVAVAVNYNCTDYS